MKQPVDANTVKTVVLPSEHGGSVMFGESLIAGLLIAASGQGLWPALGWVFLFLTGHPLKIFLKDFSRRVSVPRSRVALLFSLGFALLSVVFFAKTYLVSGPLFLIVFFGVVPLGAVHLWAVVQLGKKEFIAELFGVLSLGAAGASIVLGAGHPLSQALVLWAVLAVRGLSSVLYVRERLSRSRGKASQKNTVALVHIAGLAFFGILVSARIAGPLILMAGLFLAVRLWFVYRPSTVTARSLGIQESALGIIFVALAVSALW